MTHGACLLQVEHTVHMCTLKKKLGKLLVTKAFNWSSCGKLNYCIIRSLTHHKENNLKKVTPDSVILHTFLQMQDLENHMGHYIE
jgi:hypothetical protein